MTGAGEVRSPQSPSDGPLCIHDATVIGPEGPVERAEIRVEGGRIRSIKVRTPCRSATPSSRAVHGHHVLEGRFATIRPDRG